MGAFEPTAYEQSFYIQVDEPVLVSSGTIDLGGGLTIDYQVKRM